jgi:site-specific recombinase XerD
LLAEPGEAITVWLADGRPDCETRAVFTSIRPAGRPMTSSSVGNVVAVVCRSAHLPRIGAHRLRHTLATELLRAGATLPEVGQVLRHRNHRSTAIYAKVDETVLRPLARRWPAAGGQAAAGQFTRPWPGVVS